MSESVHNQNIEYLELSADIVSAFVSNNSIPASEIGTLLISLFTAMTGLNESSTAHSVKDKIVKPTPSQIKKSITPDALISFEDGRPYKTLRRHLKIHGLTPQGYREKWGLSPEYPMVSAIYSAKRSELARLIGLGQKQNLKASAAQSPKTAINASVETQPKRLGRPRKAVAAE